MAPLPQNSTDRLFVDYITGETATALEHTLQVRMSGGQANVVVVQGRVLAVLNALTPIAFRLGWRVLRCRFQAQGTDFSIPVSVVPGLAAFLGSGGGDYQPRMEAVEDTFQGRSNVTGRRVDLSLYRAVTDAFSNFRVPNGPTGFPAAVGNAVANLNSSAGDGAFLAIDGNPPTWYQYLNQNYNSYWERRLRSS